MRLLRLPLALTVLLVPEVHPQGADTDAARSERAESLYWAAYAAFQVGTPDSLQSAIRLWQQAGELFRELGDEGNLRSAFQQVASAFRQLGLRDSAETYVGLALRAEEVIRGPVARRPIRGVAVAAALLSGDLIGEINAPLGSGFGGDVSLRYGFPAGISIGGGGTITSHGIQGRTDPGSSFTQTIRARYNLRTLYLEPRWTLYTGRRYAPFMSGRVGGVWETVDASGARFRASGFTFGASLGLQVRIHSQLTLEGGARVQRMSFGDFSFSGEAEVDGCLVPLRSAGVALPIALSQCAGLRDFAQTSLCDVGGIISGTGCRPTTVHFDSRRRTAWLGFWAGFNLILEPR